MERRLIEHEEYQFQQFKKGSETAFKSFFDLYHDQIVGFSMQFLGDLDESKNVAQDAFVNLWVNREKVKEPKGVRSFLYTSAKSNCLNLIRHKKVVHKYSDQYLRKKERQINQDVLHSMEFDSATLSELETLIQTSIKKLPERCKRVFSMRRFDNKKNQEIAEELSISVKAVEANMTRAMRSLKHSLSNYMTIILLVFFS
ncbi:RNA polymerase sigma-70 factor [Flagellimonas myxillae]|uniref:RNA polymerase sigma-70 factor n=1 Tax=Flagellimonas myxillae TaxID=2942214 RepID=UPI00201F268A|nr:RNA polymerase sigma-70 factor [Muricauda myxillae]MCL6267876.1 RNA polymerase sigma-70 factor [Muricauda myxillae]